MAAIVALALAYTFSRSDNWCLFSFGILAVWNHSFGQSIMPASKMPARHCSIDAKSPSTHTKTLASPHWSLYSHLYLYKAHMNPAIDVLRIVAEVSDLSDGNNCLLTLNLHHSRVLGYYQFLYPGINQFPFGISSHLFPSYTARYPLALSKVK